MFQISAHKIGCELLNSAMDDLDMEVHARVLNALVLIDSQPEENEDMFFEALKYAGEVCKVDQEMLEKLIEEAQQ